MNYRILGCYQDKSIGQQHRPDQICSMNVVNLPVYISKANEMVKTIKETLFILISKFTNTGNYTYVA